MGWKEWFGMEEEEKSFLKEFEDALPSLTYKQRLIGFSVCFGAGWIVSFISAAFLPRIDTAAGELMTCCEKQYPMGMEKV